VRRGQVVSLLTSLCGRLVCLGGLYASNWWEQQEKKIRLRNAADTAGPRAWQTTGVRYWACKTIYLT